MEADSFIGDTAGGPVVVYLEVCVLEVQLLMSPVLQATGWQNVHTSMMITFAYSGEPLPTHCSTKFTAAGLWTSLRCRAPRAWQQLLRRFPRY